MDLRLRPLARLDPLAVALPHRTEVITRVGHHRSRRDRYHLGDARELVLAKRAGERTAADPALLEAWRPRLVAIPAGRDRLA